MKSQIKTVYVCPNTINGIFSGIYDAWKSGKEKEECKIALAGMVEQELFCEYAEVKEDDRKARAVEKMILNHMGEAVYWDIYHALLSADREKGDVVLGTMMEARKLKNSKKIMEHLSHPQVEKVFELSRNVAGEAHLLKGFVRFRELKNGILYAQITPKAQVLTCLAPHFADRLPQENWMIQDKSHRMYAVHEAGKDWILLQLETADERYLMQYSEEEYKYEKLWQGFCRTISIESRENPKCQRQHLPMRFRPDMVEFDS